MDNPPEKPLTERTGFLMVVLVTIVLFYTASDTLLVIVAAALAAFFLSRAAHLTSERAGGSPKLWLTVILSSGVITAWGFFALAGSQLREQLRDIGPQVSTSLQQLETELSAYPSLEQALRQAKEQTANFSLDNVQFFFNGVLGLLSGVALFVALTLYTSFQPDPYENALTRTTVRLVGRGKATKFLTRLRDHLWGFLGGQLKAMLIITVITTTGLWLLDIPMFFVLGVTAGLFAFVPVLGPLASTIPAVLVALPQGTSSVLWVLALYGFVQLVESNFLTPMLQQQSSELPPVVTLSFQATLGALAGPLGILLAAPIAVVGLVAGQVWLEDAEPELTSTIARQPAA